MSDSKAIPISKESRSPTKVGDISIHLGFNSRHFRFFDDCAKGNFEQVNKALEKKGNIDILFKNYDQRTALHIASSEHRLNICRLLLSHNAPLNIEDRWGQTPPFCTTSPEIRKFFADEYGVNYKGSGEDSLSKILQHTKDGNKAAVIKCIMSGKDEAVNCRDVEQKTPLHIAAAQGSPVHIDIIHILLHNGALIDAKDSFDNTPLTVSKIHGHAQAVKVLEYYSRGNKSLLAFSSKSM